MIIFYRQSNMKLLSMYPHLYTSTLTYQTPIPIRTTKPSILFLNRTYPLRLFAILSHLCYSFSPVELKHHIKIKKWLKYRASTKKYILIQLMKIKHGFFCKYSVTSKLEIVNLFIGYLLSHSRDHSPNEISWDINVNRQEQWSPNKPWTSAFYKSHTKKGAVKRCR